MATRSLRRKFRHRGRATAERFLTSVLLAAVLLAVAPLSVAPLSGNPFPAGALLAPAAGGPDASVPQCASTPSPAAIIPDTPWPQQRYDLSALSQITDGAGVIVAVVDSGVDPSHPQLGAAVRAGDDLLDRGGDARLDCVGHGTAIASIIAARPVPGSGLRGIAPAATIRPVRVSERVENGGAPAGDGDVADLAAGISAAVASRPKPGVINLSISTTGDHPALSAVIRSALDADIVVVAAVGNQHEQGDPTPYPASYSGVLGVGAIGPDGVRVPSSQIGSYVDIVAPGDRVVGAVPRGGHLAFQGTSFATPFVAATAALIRARWPQLSQAEVVRRLVVTADPAPGRRPSPDYGYGILNPLRALTEIVAPLSTEVATPPMPPPAVAAPQADAARWPSATRALPALAAATVLLLAAAALAALALAIPAGRRRGWRPGRVESRPARR